jgi:heme oxygenase
LFDDSNAQATASGRAAECFDAIAELRSATQFLHAQLDAQLPLSNPAATLTDYVVHLSVVRDWRICLSPWLARTSLQPGALALIEQDLEDCPAEVAKLPDLPTMRPDLLVQSNHHCAAFSWGIAYVVEGSLLGGKVLYRRLKQQLHPHPLRYLGKSSDDAVSWPETLQAVRRHAPSGAASALACAGATAAFEMLLERFRQAGYIR